MRRMRGAAPARRGLAMDTVLSLGAIFLVGGSAILFSIVYGRARGEAALGAAALALAVGTGLPQVAFGGLVPALTRFVSARRAASDAAGAGRALRRGLLAFAGLGAALGLACALSAPLWAPSIGLPDALVASVAALVVLESLYYGGKAALYGLARVDVYARLELLGGLGFLLGLLALLWLPGRATPLLPFLAADLAFLVFALPLLAHALHRLGETEASGSASTPAADRTGSMARWAAVAWLGTAATLARLRLPVVVTGLVYGLAEVGRMQAALVFFAPVMFLPRAMELALLPRLAADFGADRRSALRAGATRATEAIAAGLVAIGGSLLVAGPALLALLYGPGFAAAAPAMDGVVVAAWLIGLASPSIVALSGADGIAQVNVAGLAGLLASLAAWALWVPPRGAAGAAWGLALGSAAMAVIPLWIARRRYGIDPVPALRITALGLLSLVPALALGRWAPGRWLEAGAAPGGAALVSLAVASLFALTALWASRASWAPRARGGPA